MMFLREEAALEPIYLENGLCPSLTQAECLSVFLVDSALKITFAFKPETRFPPPG